MTDKKDKEKLEKEMEIAYELEKEAEKLPYMIGDVYESEEIVWENPTGHFSH